MPTCDCIRYAQGIRTSWGFSVLVLPPGLLLKFLIITVHKKSAFNILLHSLNYPQNCTQKRFIFNKVSGKVGKEAEGVRKYGVEENIWT